MIVLAIVPAVWRRVMDPRVLRHFDGDLTRANLSPRKRDQLLARYGGSARRAGGGPEEPSEVRRPGPAGLPATPTDQPADEALSWRCPGCGYTYDVVTGEEREGFAAGTAWSQIPSAWCCPDCGVREKVDFVAVEATAVTG
jgi:alkane 1-monooxygenase